jgi:hypothetical protein
VQTGVPEESVVSIFSSKTFKMEPVLYTTSLNYQITRFHIRDQYSAVQITNIILYDAVCHGTLGRSMSTQQMAVYIREVCDCHGDNYEDYIILEYDIL